MKTPFFIPTFRTWALFSAITLLAACRFSRTPEAPPLPLSQKVLWYGKTASGYSDSIPGRVDSAAIESVVRIHFFRFPGSDSVQLRLDEYPQGWGAYSVFQQAASQDEMAQGWYYHGNELVFRQGKYLGHLTESRSDRISGESAKMNLSFIGEELFAKPGEFAAFPLLGRIPNSDRVIPGRFLGCAWQGPVFTVEYRCHGDTATAFRGFAQNRDSVQAWMRRWTGKTDTVNWGREIHFKGQDEFRRPLIFWLFSEGMMGFSGCSDSVLAAEYAQKLQKTAVLWPNP